MSKCLHAAERRAEFAFNWREMRRADLEMERADQAHLDLQALGAAHVQHLVAQYSPVVETKGLVDLDAIKAAGLNSDAHSRALLAQLRRAAGGDGGPAC